MRWMGGSGGGRRGDVMGRKECKKSMLYLRRVLANRILALLFAAVSLGCLSASYSGAQLPSPCRRSTARACVLQTFSTFRLLGDNPNMGQGASPTLPTTTSPALPYVPNHLGEVPANSTGLCRMPMSERLSISLQAREGRHIAPSEPSRYE